MPKARILNGARFTPVGDDDATFTLDNSHVEDAQFTLVTDEGRKTEQDEEADIQLLLEREGLASAEAAFLAGERKYVISSNVSWIEYHWLNPDRTPLELLYVGYKDGSVYEYEGFGLNAAKAFYNASSYGKFVWDELRVRGTVFGYQYPYRLVAGSRVWYNAGASSQARHEAIPKSGEPFGGYHPATAWRGAPGAMGKARGGVNLNKRGGSKKVSAFLPPQVNFGGFPASGPFGK